MSDITPETELVSILEIQGIKFTTRNFQIEIELKQVMIMDNERIFESCLIKSNKRVSAVALENKPTANATSEAVLTSNAEVANGNMMPTIVEPPTQKIEVELTLEPLEKEMDDFLEDLCKDKDNENENENHDDNHEKEKENENENENENDTLDIDIEFEDLNEVDKEDDIGLREIAQTELSLDKTTDTITLKKPNQVYFELYKEAREKAKQAKKNAIIAYLEAKNIKKTYMIENMNDSESDIDAEIDDVSESELEYL